MVRKGTRRQSSTSGGPPVIPLDLDSPEKTERTEKTEKSEKPEQPEKPEQLQEPQHQDPPPQSPRGRRGGADLKPLDAIQDAAKTKPSHSEQLPSPRRKTHGMEASHSDQGFGSPKIKKSTDGTPKKKRGKKEGEVSPPPEADAHPEVAAEGKGGRVLAKSKEAEESEKIPEVQVSEAKVDLKAELKKEASKERREEPKPMEQPIVQPKAEPKEPKVEPKEEPKEEPKVEPKEEPKVEPKEEPKQEPKVEPKEEPKAEPTAEPKAEPKEEPKVEPKEEPKEKPIEEAKKEEPKEDSSTTKSSPSTPDEVAVSKPSASSPFLTLKSLHPSQPSLHPSQPSQSSQPSPRTQISGFPRPQSPKVITTKPSPFAGRPPPALPLQDVKPLPSTSSFRQRLLFYQHLESNNAEEKDKESKEKKPGASTIGRKTEIHVEKESSEDEESSDEDIKVIDEEIKRTAKKLSSLMEHRKSISVPANFSPEAYSSNATRNIFQFWLEQDKSTLEETLQQQHTSKPSHS